MIKLLTGQIDFSFGDGTGMQRPASKAPVRPPSIAPQLKEATGRSEATGSAGSDQNDTSNPGHDPQRNHPDIRQRNAERWLNVRELAKRLSVSRATVWRWTKEDSRFPKPSKFGKKTTRWRLSDVIAFEDARDGGHHD